MENNRADRVLIRAKDIGLIIGILTLAGMLFKVGAKPFEWDQALGAVNEMRAKITDHENRLTTIETRFLDAQESTNKQLAAIFRKLDDNENRRSR